MTGLLVDIGRKLGEKWVALLILPGLLYVAVAVIGHLLSWRHSLDVPLLAAAVNSWSRIIAFRSAGGVILILLAILLASLGAALAAQALGAAIARCWVAEHWKHWPQPMCSLAKLMTRLRASRWDRAIINYRLALQEFGRNEALAAAGIVVEQPYDLAELHFPVARVSRERPVRPTWVGDRINTVVAGLRRRYGVDVPLLWPALWLTMPTAATEAIDAARNAYQRAATLVAWALLYAVVGIVWWPALLVAGVTAVTGTYRARVAIEDYCLLVDAAVVLHTPDLLRAVGIPHVGELDRKAGTAITRYFQGSSSHA